MKRALICFLILALMLSGCAEPAQEQLEGLEGSWYSEYEELRILGDEAEFTGYYDLDGQRLAGVITLGKVTADRDGSIEIDVEGYVLTGRLVDEHTLILGEITYTR